MTDEIYMELKSKFMESEYQSSPRFLTLTGSGLDAGRLRKIL